MQQMTIEEVVDSFSADLEPWQREVNLSWLRTLHAMLTEGGIWGCPALSVIYEKSGDGFIEVTNADKH